MSERIISTVEDVKTFEDLKSFLKNTLSEARYKHVTGVAETTEKILAHYKCSNYIKEWNRCSAGIFCGMAHDLSREWNPEQWIKICDENGSEYSPEEKQNPVFLHGYASAVIIKKIFPDVPESWIRAIEIHTLGDSNMDELALALFIADYLEPNRTYLTDEQRMAYMTAQTIQQCAYAVLCDNIKHQKSKGSSVMKKNLKMKAFLENK